MAKPSITAEEAARCLKILEQAESPMVAADLATGLFLPGTRETQRRHVRAIIEDLRENGSMIVATLQQGYWLTEDISLWRKYNEDRQIDAKSILAETHKRKRQLAAGKGQGVLFDMQVPAGCASVGISKAITRQAQNG